jgi:hypothetical protein
MNYELWIMNEYCSLFIVYCLLYIVYCRKDSQ